MSFLNSSLSWHTVGMKSAAGETVTYSRGNACVELSAVVGQTVFEDVGAEGETRSQLKSVDFLILPAELLIDGLTSEPQRGDQITRADGDKFDVMSGSSGTVWQWSDGRKTYFRIHTVRRVKSE